MSIFKKTPLLIVTLFFYSCTGMFFQPTRQLYPISYMKGIKKTDLFFQSTDGTRLHGWLLEPNTTPVGTVLFIHGNAENIRTHTRAVLFLVRAGYRVVVFDYRGYGLSEGNPEIDGIYQDAEAALELALRYSTDGKAIVLGQSLGGAVALYIVATSKYKDRVRALVVDSAFSGYRRIAREKLGLFFLTSLLKGPLSLLVSDRYSPERYVSKLTVPVVFIHGLNDRVVPPHHSFFLYKKAGSKDKQLWYVYGADHIQALFHKSVQQRLLEYLRSLP